MSTKPLGMKAYGSIPHLPGSRVGPGDHACPMGQARICTEKPRNEFDVITVTEKLDGSCCAVALQEGKILPLVRAGYLATTSPYQQHHYFAQWVYANEDRFRASLREGERLVGEWLAQAHGTRYKIGPDDDPFVVFDVMVGHRRLPWHVLVFKACRGDFQMPQLLSYGPPFSIAAAQKAIQVSGHGAIDPVEGAVWRVETKRSRDQPYYVDFLAKWVRPDKEDGCYLPEVSGQPAIWNWQPD